MVILKLNLRFYWLFHCDEYPDTTYDNEVKNIYVSVEYKDVVRFGVEVWKRYHIVFTGKVCKKAKSGSHDWYQHIPREQSYSIGRVCKSARSGSRDWCQQITREQRYSIGIVCKKSKSGSRDLCQYITREQSYSIGRVCEKSKSGSRDWCQYITREQRYRLRDGCRLRLIESVKLVW